MMKLSKILMTTLAAAAVVGMAGCKSNDDPNDMIKGSNKVYTIDYTNEDAFISRGYKETAYKHAGAAVQIDFTDVTSTTAKAGVMGLIFDLEGKAGKSSRDFNIIGVRAKNASGAIDFYVSRYENIEDIQADNFGAKTDAAEGEPKEIEYVTAFADGTGTFADGTTTVFVYAIQKKADADGTDTIGKDYNAGEFLYKVYLLNNKVAKLDKDGNLVDDEGNVVVLDDSDAVAIMATGYTKLTQKKLAVYANVYPTAENKDPSVKTSGCGTLTGTWTYRGDYKEVGVED